MVNVTYRDLLEMLRALPQSRLDDDVTVYIRADDEYFAARRVYQQPFDDVLDKGHVFLVIDG